MPLAPKRRWANIAVFSKGKPEMTYTADWFRKYGFHGRPYIKYVVSPGDDVAGYEKSTGCRVVVAHGCHNLPSKRQWATDHLTTDECPWLLFLEDNIQRVTAVLDHLYNQHYIENTTRHDFHSQEVGPQYVIGRMEQDIKLAEQVGACFGGYACNDNHFFRKRKYRHVAFVWTKMAYVRRGGPRWPRYCDEKDDYGFTSENLLRVGRVVVNNYLYPWSMRYEGRGGSRTIEERAEDRRAAVDELMRRYPGLWRLKDKPGSPPGTELVLRFHSDKQVDEWRRSLGVTC